MKVIGLTRTAREIEIPITIDGVGEVISTVKTSTDLDEVLGKADFITMNVPKQEDGKAVIGKAEFAKMKDGVRIVNVARGGVIRSEEHTSELQSRPHLVCRLLLEKKKT